MTRDKAAEASALCVACGCCCDGTLFASVRLDDGEAVRLSRLSLPVVVRDDLTEAMPQPCAALQGTRCGVYEERPATCRKYRCHLLAALDEGEVSIDEARSLVALVRGAADDLRRRVPEGLSHARRIALPSRWRKGQTPPDPSLAEAVEALEEVLDTHFRGRFRGV